MSRTTTLRLKLSFHRRPQLRTWFLLTLGFAIATGIGVLFIASNHKPVSQSSRFPASENPKSKKHTHFIHESDIGLQRTAKLTPPVRTSLDMDPYLRSLSKGEEFTLKAKIHSKFPGLKIQFQWILPSGIELISGEKSGSFEVTSSSSDSTEVPTEISILLRNTTDENLRIGFSVDGSGAEHEFSDHVQIQTQDELSWREKKSRLKERAKKYMEDKGQLKRE